MPEFIVETPKCVMCGNTAVLEVSFEGFVQWQRGAFVQEAFPELDSDQRELLMTGTHAHCWEGMWAGFDEEGDDGDVPN